MSKKTTSILATIFTCVALAAASVAFALFTAQSARAYCPLAGKQVCQEEAKAIAADREAARWNRAMRPMSDGLAHFMAGAGAGIAY